MLSTPYISSVPVTKIILPDLVSHCKFEKRVSRHQKQITSETKHWLFKDNSFPPKVQDGFHGLKAGLLSSMCYPDAGYPQLRVVNDFLSYLFHIDNISDEMDVHGTHVTSDVVLNALHFPNTDRSPTQLGKMTREYVNVTTLFYFILHI